MNHSHISIHEIERLKDCSDKGLYCDFEYPDNFSQSGEDARGVTIEVAQNILPSPSLPVYIRLKAGYRRFVVALWILFPAERPHRDDKRCAEFLGIDQTHYCDLKSALMAILGCKGPDPDRVGAFDEEAETIKRILRRLVLCGEMRGRRFWLAGYRRFVVSLWMIDADIFGGAAIEDIAEELNISTKSVYKIRERLGNLS